MSNISFVGSTIRVSGPFMTKDFSAELRKNVEDAIDKLAQKGAELVRSNLDAGIRVHGPTTPPTASGVIGQVVRGGNANPFGAVFMRPGIRRGSNSGARGLHKYSDARVPYIIAAVLESGHYRGSPRQAVHQTSKARVRLIPMIRSTFDDLAKGLT